MLRIMMCVRCSIERDIVLGVSARSGCVTAVECVTDKHWDRWHGALRNVDWVWGFLLTVIASLFAQ